MIISYLSETTHLTGSSELTTERAQILTPYIPTMQLLTHLEDQMDSDTHIKQLKETINNISRGYPPLDLSSAMEHLKEIHNYQDQMQLIDAKTENKFRIYVGLIIIFVILWLCRNLIKKFLLVVFQQICTKIHSSEREEPVATMTYTKAEGLDLRTPQYRSRINALNKNQQLRTSKDIESQPNTSAAQQIQSLIRGEEATGL